MRPDGAVQTVTKSDGELRLRAIPGSEHDYMMALLGAMPPGFITQHPYAGAQVMDAGDVTKGVDVVHIGWPEHIFGRAAGENAEFDARYVTFLDVLADSPARVVWTLHNRRPHLWEAERGRELYRRVAEVADGLIHHSEWGMRLMRAELPFTTEAKHVVIPHGHFGDQLRLSKSRAEVEAQLGLRPCAMRFGVLGRPQREKQVEMILRAFERGGQRSHQLVVTAYDESTPRSRDPRIVFLSRKSWMLRDEVAHCTHVCDGLVSAHSGDTYLTSGISADAVGIGAAMLAPDWAFFHETLGDAAFYHANTESSLARLFATITHDELTDKKSAMRALQPRFAWPGLAARTIEFYHSIGRKPNRQRLSNACEPTV